MVRLSRNLFFLISLGMFAFLTASASERSDFAAATNKFNSGFWEQAENDFANFVKSYPASPRVPEAILYEGKAKFARKDFGGAVGLLSTNRSNSGKFADQFLYWIGKAQLENTNYAAAAESFHELAGNFPESPQRLDAAVSEGRALAQMQDWPRVANLLEDANGVFQKSAQSGTKNETMTAGYLLLADAQLAQGRLDDAKQTLDLLGQQSLTPVLNWNRHYLESRWLLAAGQLDAALQSSTNLIATPNPTNHAEGILFQAGILERMDRLDEAIATNKLNLATNVPGTYQRRSLLKIAELSLSQQKLGETTRFLEQFLAQFPNAGAADLAWLTLGELRLKQATVGITNTASATTNLLSALTNFQMVVTTFSNSPFAPKAMLGEGWCLWLQGRTNDSAAMFRLAAERLPFSREQAEARFKWADTQFELKDFAGAVANYEVVATNYDTLPEVKTNFVEIALYQMVRAALEMNDFASASNAIAKILADFPEGFAGPQTLLLAGQAFTEDNNTEAARALFAEFERRFPTNALVPELRLAIARMFEQGTNWDAAITNYTGWISDFPTNDELPRAEFGRAWDYYKAGNATNALAAFTNFVARFPANQLTPRAYWWIGDYFMNEKDYSTAEIWYQLVFSTNTPSSELRYEARMMAGKAAMARTGYKDAIDYYTNLATDVTCPLDLRLQATFAYGDAMTLLDPGETNKLANWERARGIFNSIVQNYPSNKLAVLAWGRIGDCFFQLGSADPTQYTNAIGAYEKVFDLPQSTAADRAGAKIGLGHVLEKQAALKTGEDQSNLLKNALNDYLDVLFDKDLREGEKPDPRWTKIAGMEAARLAESLHEWMQAMNVYRRLQDLFPSLHDSLDKKILRAQERGNSEKNSDKS